MSEEIVVKFMRATPDGIVPAYQTVGAAGADVYATKSYVIRPGNRALIQTDIILEVPEGYEMQVRPRSSLALKHGVTVLNTPGTIDSDYRGCVGVVLINLGTETFTVNPGDRIAQFVLQQVCRARYTEINELTSTTRGAGGYGSTGT